MHRLLPSAMLAAFFMLTPKHSYADGEDVVRTKSPAMIATGIGAMTAGSVAVGSGIGFVTLYTKLPTVIASQCPQCTPKTIPRDGDYLVGGTIAIVTGALVILGAIPLVYFGAKHERRTGVWLTAGGVSGSF